MSDSTKNSKTVTSKEFEDLWSMSFKDLAMAATTGEGYTARRFVLQCRLGDAALQAATWTRWGVIIALGSAAASLVVAAILS